MSFSLSLFRKDHSHSHFVKKQHRLQRGCISFSSAFTGREHAMHLTTYVSSVNNIVHLYTLC